MQITDSNPIFTAMAKSQLYLKLLCDGTLPFASKYIKNESSGDPILDCIHNIAVASLASQFNIENAATIVNRNLKENLPYLADATALIFKDQKQNLTLHKLLTNASYYKCIAVAAGKLNFTDVDPLRQCISEFALDHDKFHQIWNDYSKEKNLPILEKAVDLLEKNIFTDKLISDRKFFELVGVESTKFLESGIRIDRQAFECIKQIATIYTEFFCGANPEPMVQELLFYHDTVFVDVLGILNENSQGKIQNYCEIVDMGLFKQDNSEIPGFSAENKKLISLILKNLKKDYLESLLQDKEAILRTLEIYSHQSDLVDLDTLTSITVVFFNPNFREQLFKENDKDYFDTVMRKLKSILNNFSEFPADGFLLQCKYDIDFRYK